MIENLICKLYKGSNLTKTYCYEDENTRTEIVCNSTYDENLYIDVQPKSSKKLT